LSVGRGGRVPHQLTSSGDTGSSRPSRTHCRSQRRLTAMASVSAPCRCSASKTGLAVDWQMQCVALRKSSSCWHSAPCLRPADGDHRGMHACMPSAGIGDTAAGAGKTCRICAPRQYVTRRAQLSSRDRLLAQERRHASQHPLGTLRNRCRRPCARRRRCPRRRRRPRRRYPCRRCCLVGVGVLVGRAGARCRRPPGSRDRMAQLL
jgi:hypothetical protein